MAKPLKFRNVPTIIGAEKYRSKRERDRHQDLLLLQRAGKITGLARELLVASSFGAIPAFCSFGVSSSSVSRSSRCAAPA